MNKYQTLVNILDRIRAEATTTPYQAIYLPDPGNGDAVTQARSRAILHLYLMVSFGLLNFPEREYFVTEGKYDGGIDAYYVDKENHTIYFIQAKYRATDQNFSTKLITVNELLAMDISRILGGEASDELGNTYNEQIQGMQSRIAAIDDIGRYDYKVVILANAPNLAPAKIKQLTGGVPTTIIDNEQIYLDLVLPVIAGTYFKKKDLTIALDLSNKNAGAKISYEVHTTHYDCEITVVFVPIIEIAQIMYRYKNSILLFNPRSYLELEGHIVNDAIRETVLGTPTNEFALLNNGITILSDETYINEKIGQRNKAQLTLRNPQIINGGQTAYTLSRIREETPETNLEATFKGKEVLLKVITLIADPKEVDTEHHRMDLIDKISTATNRQTPVITADKFSNNQDHVKIQRVLFDRYGILYERKRGEFADGLHKGYITADRILERNLFFRLYFGVVGDFEIAVRKKLFMKVEDPSQTIQDGDIMNRIYFAFLCFKDLSKDTKLQPRMTRNRSIYLRLYALSHRAPKDLGDFAAAATDAVSSLDSNWADFVMVASHRSAKLWGTKTDKRTQEKVRFFDRQRWIQTGQFLEDARNLFGSKQTALEAARISQTTDATGTAPQALDEHHH
jgi:AIPR protein